MPDSTIRCEQCGSDRITKYKSTKYCHVCRTAKNLMFLGNRTADCWLCDKKFAPLTRNDVMCAECDDRVRSYSVRGECDICEEQTDLWQKDIMVCIPCAKNPKHRARVLKGLLAKVQWLKKNPIRLNNETA